jgi:hypothetical protein
LARGYFVLVFGTPFQRHSRRTFGLARGVFVAALPEIGESHKNAAISRSSLCCDFFFRNVPIFLISIFNFVFTSWYEQVLRSKVRSTYFILFSKSRWLLAD